MPENPVYSRDDGHFIYLATVELGNNIIYYLEEGGLKMKLRFLLSVFLVFSLLLPATVTSADHSQLAPILASNPFDTNKVDGHSKQGNN